MPIETSYPLGRSTMSMRNYSLKQQPTTREYKSIPPERLEKQIRGLIWQAMKLCRNLDLRAGCPPTFINGLWAPLYEHEVLQSSTLPDGWTIRSGNTTQPQPQQEPPPQPNKRIYRYVTTGEEFDKHTIENVERLLQKARTAEPNQRTNIGVIQNHACF